MAMCVRPVWTCCFIFMWVLLLPGLILIHAAIGTLSPVVVNLPTNLVEGFEETFRFSHVEETSKGVKTTAEEAVARCREMASSFCPNIESNTQSVINLDGVQLDKFQNEKTYISNAFGETLGIVQKVANDKYLAIGELKDVATRLNEMKTKFDEMEETMTCRDAVPRFCAIYEASDGMIKQISDVNNAIDTFKNSPIMQQQENIKAYVNLIHILPYPLVLAILFLTCFWARGGICCCCEGGTIFGCLLIPFMLLWFLSEIVSIIIFVVCSALSWGQGSIPLNFLKGSPTLAELITHIKEEYTPFYVKVFQPWEKPGTLLHGASGFFIVVCFLSFWYCCCLVTCRPYRASKGDSEGGSGSCPVDKKTAAAFLQACREEYVEEKGPMVGAFFDGAGGDAAGKLGRYEDRVRAAGDKAQEINNIASEWGVIPGVSY